MNTKLIDLCRKAARTKNMNKQQVKKLLSEAADLIDTRGWTQGTLEATDETGRTCYCAMGAIFQASENGFYSFEDQFDALSLMNEACPTKPPGLQKATIAWWNDEPGRTAEEVVAKLREAAASAEE